MNSSGFEAPSGPGGSGKGTPIRTQPDAGSVSSSYTAMASTSHRSAPKRASAPVRFEPQLRSDYEQPYNLRSSSRKRFKNSVGDGGISDPSGNNAASGSESPARISLPDVDHCSSSLICGSAIDLSLVYAITKGGDHEQHLTKEEFQSFISKICASSLENNLVARFHWTRYVHDRFMMAALDEQAVNWLQSTVPQLCPEYRASRVTDIIQLVKNKFGCFLPDHDEADTDRLTSVIREALQAVDPRANAILLTKKATDDSEKLLWIFAFNSRAARALLSIPDQTLRLGQTQAVFKPVDRDCQMVSHEEAPLTRSSSTSSHT